MTALSVNTKLLAPYPFKGLRLKNATGKTQEAGTGRALPAGQIYQLSGDNRWRVIVCQAGEIWITQAGDVRDYLISAGEMFLITRSGGVVIQALEPASIQVTPSLQATVCPRQFAETVFA